jgi:hypothetical protein
MKFELKPHNRNVPDNELIADLKRVAAKLGKSSVTRNECDEHGRFNSETIKRRFDSWPNVLMRANLGQTKKGIKKIPDEKLLDDLKLVAKQIQKSGVTKTKIVSSSHVANNQSSASFSCHAPRQFQMQDYRSLSRHRPNCNSRSGSHCSLG